MSNKFKDGDRVKRIRGEHGGMKVGDIGTVVSIENTRSVRLQEYPYTGPHDLDNLELVTEAESELERPGKESELERLVRVANEGKLAYLKLEAEFKGQWEPCDRQNHFTLYRVIQKPTFEPFTVGSGWLVELKGETLHIGCQNYEPKYLASDLRAVSYKGKGANYDLFAIREGVMDKEGHIISWADADKILAALEKAGV